MAAKTLLRRGFEEMGTHRITAVCNAQNTKASRVLETIGMRREAVFVEKLFLDGKWTDQFVYAILDREYAEMTSDMEVNGLKNLEASRIIF
jgi:RimJ/RimL family protein N-acetyltransferase